MKIRAHSDFWCGLLFVVIGLAVVVLAQNYRFGTAARHRGRVISRRCSAP